MQQVMINIPDTSLQLLKSSVDAFVEELRLATATQFYRQDILPFDIAAQLAGLAPDEFSKEVTVVEKNGAKDVFYEDSSEAWSKNMPDIIPSPMPREPKPLDIRALAAAQGVNPIKDIKDFQTGFWPEDESIDDFVKTIRSWRDEALTLERELPDYDQ